MSDDQSTSRAPAASSADIEFTVHDIPTARQLSWWGTGVGIGCTLIALLAAAFGWYDHSQPLTNMLGFSVAQTIGFTVAGLVSLSMVAIATLLIPLRRFGEFQQFVSEFLVPLAKPLSVVQIGVISAAAGIGEELLFRWSLQGGFQSAFPGLAGTIVGLCVTSVLFGLCHAVTIVYAIMAAAIGGLLGGIMIASGSVVPAILAHGLYDFAALWILRGIARGKIPFSHVRHGPPE